MQAGVERSDYKDKEEIRLSAHAGGVLSLARIRSSVFSGSHDGSIIAWSIQTLRPKIKLFGHAGVVRVLHCPRAAAVESPPHASLSRQPSQAAPFHPICQSGRRPAMLQVLLLQDVI